MSRYLFLIMVFGLYIQPASAQVTAPPDTVDVAADTAAVDTTAIGADGEIELPEEEEEEEVVIQEPVVPLEFSGLPAFNMVTTDSLLRWELWANPAERYHYKPGNITYRLGGLGRNEGLLLSGHENRHQRVYHEGILFNDRVSGSMNTNRMPHQRFARVFERTQSVRHITDYQNRRFYITEPLTSISYDQGEFNFRSTEGYFTRNIGRATNIELSYWGKNDDGDYHNSEFSGRKASGRAFHHISGRLIGEAGILYNGLQLDEPGSYMLDMYNFGFVPFNATPEDGQARSSVRNSLVYSTLWYRPDEDAEANSQITAYHNGYRRFYFGSVDSTFYQTASNGLLARRWLEAGPISLHGSLNAEHTGVNEDTNRSLDRTSWMRYTGRGEGSFALSEIADVSGWGMAEYRSDGYRDYEIGAKVTGELSRFSLHASFAVGDQMPTIQQLYWNSETRQGNPGLGNESMNRMEAGIRFRPFGPVSLGATAYRKEVTNPIMMSPDSLFIQTGHYYSEGAELYAAVDAARFEGDITLTVQQFSSGSSFPLDQQLAQSGSRIWSRASAFYKNYMFDSAAFVKAGGHVLFSPNPYRSGTYYPGMDYWDSNSFDQAIPGFHRLDLELSARVRSVMVLLRLENVLHQVTQFGYFETAHHPMPGRVFRFGVKWIMRN